MYLYIYDYIYIYIPAHWHNRVLANDLGDQGSFVDRVVPKTQKMVTDASFLTAQHYKVEMKGRWRNPEKRVVPSRTLGYDTKQSDGEAPVILSIWGMQSNPPLPLLPGSLWPRVVAPDRALPMGQIEWFHI